MSELNNDDLRTALQRLDRSLSDSPQRLSGSGGRSAEILPAGSLSAKQLASTVRARRQRRVGITCSVAAVGICFCLTLTPRTSTVATATVSTSLAVPSDASQGRVGGQLEETQSELEQLRVLCAEGRQLLAEIRANDGDLRWQNPSENELSENEFKQDETSEVASATALFYASHLLESGAEIRKVQERLESVMMYFPGTVGAANAAKMLAEITSKEKQSHNQLLRSLRNV